MAILMLRDGKLYQERCPGCGGIHIIDLNAKGSYEETERYVCADCGHRHNAPLLMASEASAAEREACLPFPDARKDFLHKHSALLLRSFAHWTGRPLMDAALTPDEQVQALFHAPFALVSHGTEVDPLFNYANQQALTLFEMSWDEFTRLPSRLSAEQMHREERAHLLSTVAHQGYIDNYRGIRIAKSGQRFWIENAIVWNLLDTENRYVGQAAMFDKWQFLF